MTDEAYVYYLPAFLVATLHNPLKWAMYSGVNEKIRDVMSHFSLDQLDALIAFCDFHARLVRSYPQIPGGYEDSFLEAVEDLQLRFMLRADELRAKGK